MRTQMANALGRIARNYATANRMLQVAIARSMYASTACTGAALKSAAQGFDRDG